MLLEQLWQNCSAIVPELILALTICLVVVADMFASRQHSRSVAHGLATVGLVWALGLVCTHFFSAESEARYVFDSMIRADGLTAFFKLVILLGTLIVFAFSFNSRELAGYRMGEYYSLMLGAAMSGCLLVASANWIMFVLALETLSMCSYVLAGFVKHERPSAEAGLKYMIYGAVASGVMVFGLSYVYGLSGTLNISKSLFALTNGLYASQNVTAIVFAGLLVLVGLGFKLAMVPFQFWCPDVYQGAPTPVTAFLAVVSKAAALGAVVRLATMVKLSVPLTIPVAAADAIQMPQALFPVLFGLLAVVTMSFGNLAALRQTDAKRLLAYSSIAHAGYLLMGLAVWNGEAMRAMMAYLFMYLFMNLGAFWVVIVLINRVGSAELNRFRGVGRQAPWLAAALFVFLIALTGLPPTCGISAKVILFKAVLSAGLSHMPAGELTMASMAYYLLALVGMLNSVVSLFYYMKFMNIMVFAEAEPQAPVVRVGVMDGVMAYALVLPTLGLIYFQPVMDLVSAACSLI